MLFIGTQFSSKQPLMVRTFLKVYMELSSYFLFLQEQIKDIIIWIRQPKAAWVCVCLMIAHKFNTSNRPAT